MLTQTVRRQLIAFVIVTVLGATYAIVEYLQIPQQFGVGRYTVTLQLNQTGGLYPNALVTYRGVDVGKVQDIDMGDGSVRAELSIRDSTRIPRDVAVSVRNTSAVGELYVEFEPRTDSGKLADGETIPADKVNLPPPVGDLLSSTNQLAATLPLDQLTRTVDEAGEAFNGTGQPLQRILDSGSQFVEQARANLDPTVKLFEDLQPVLATQQRSDSATRSFSGDLAAVTDTLRARDGTIRSAIEKAPPFANETDALFNQLRPTMPLLLTDLTLSGEVLRTYNPNLRMLLVEFPGAMHGMSAGIAQADKLPPALQNAAPIATKLVVNDPPLCTKGYETVRHSPSKTENNIPPATDSYCKEPKDSPTGVRGIRNAPCPPGSPTGPGSTGARAEDCGLHFQNPEEAANATRVSVQHQMEVAARNPKTREENDAFIGNTRPPTPSSTRIPDHVPTVNGSTRHSDEPNGLLSPGGLPLNPENNPLDLLPPDSPILPSGLQRYLLDPMGALPK